MILLMAAPVLAAPPDCTPALTEPSESFAGGKTCWAAGPAVCDNTYTIGGGAGSQSIDNSPASGYPWCSPEALKVTDAASGFWMYRQIDETIPSGAVGDLYFTLYVDSQSMSAGTDAMVLAMSGTNTGGGNRVFQVAIGMNRNVFNLQVLAGVNSASPGLPITTGTTYLVHLYINGANSYAQLNGGPPLTFTAGSNAIKYLTFGGHANTTLTYHLGSVWGNFPGNVLCSPPTSVLGFGAGTIGNTPAAADIIAGLIGVNNYTVTLSSTGVAGSFAYVAAPTTPPYTTPLDVCGQSLTTAGGTNAVQYTTSGGTGGSYWQFALPAAATYGNVWSMTCLVQTDIGPGLGGQNFYDVCGIIDKIGRFSSVFHWLSRASTVDLVYEGVVSGIASMATMATGISPGHNYNVALLYDGVNAIEEGCVYDADNGNVPVGACPTVSAPGIDQAFQWIFGKPGSESGSAGHHYDFERITVCFDGQFPCGL